MGDQQPEGDLSSNSPSKPFSGGARADYGATGHRQAPEDLEIPKKSKSIPTRHLDIQDMNQTALTRAKKIRYFLGVGFGIVLLTTTLVLVLVLNREEDAEETQIYSHTDDKAPGDAITFEDFISRSFSAKTFNGSWWSNSELQWKDKEGNLVTWNINTNETTILVSNDLLTMFSSGAQFKGFSPDNTLLLFAFDIQHVWRHSYTARYVVFESAANTSYNVVAGDGAENLQYCDWVENENDQNILIYVSKNNLYWKPDGAKETAADDATITNDGEVDNVFNGIPDWVYEEEVLGVNYAHYINGEGSRIAFAQFNDSLVPDFRYPHYGNPQDILHSQYPEYRVVRYPKAGEVNPTMTLFVRTVGEDLNKPVAPPVEVSAWGEYIYTVADWTGPDVLSLTWMNRIQNQSIISECREAGEKWSCKTIFSQKQEHGWIEIAPPRTYSRDVFIQILPSLQESDSRHYKHIAKIDPASDGTVVFLTRGNFVVTEILSWDSVEGLIYFMGTDSLRPGSRHLYVVSDNGSMDSQCITCTIKTSRGEVCDRNLVEMNFNDSFYIHTCLGKSLPESSLRRTADHTIVFLFEDNMELEEKLSSKSLPTRIDTFVELEGGFQAPVKMLLPPDMDEESKYPLLVYVYGGPGSQMVSDSWSVGWAEYLVTSRKVIYASIDGRGTGFQSDEHLFQVYRHLGTVEIQDQISVTRQLVQTYPYLDEKRTAIWGWSYGGFATAMTLEQDTGSDQVFSCGISVAPVSSWLLYDSIYTERYMALPEDNVAGYDNDVITGIENLRNKTWMLNHGVADDNVHFQHSMLLTRALEQADIQFVQHSYPDENHSLGGVSRFLYHAMDDFWKKCFEVNQ